MSKLDDAKTMYGHAHERDVDCISFGDTVVVRGVEFVLSARDLCISALGLPRKVMNFVRKRDEQPRHR